MQKIWDFLTARTSLTVIGWVAFAALLFIAARLLQWPSMLPWIVLGIALLAGAGLWAWRRRRNEKKAQQIGAMLEQQADKPVPDATQRQETEVIRKRLLDAIATIKGSKLGQLSGSAALYELPWYMIIGNPAAGKSTAIASSGLQFPFADSKVVQPFNRNLALKYPFATEAKAEASNAEIGEIFGPDGAIAKFFTTTVGPLVVRRGDSLSPRTWADMGVNLAPNVVASFPGWVAPLAAGGVANAAASGGGEAQTRFDVQALATSGASEFTLEIDGQALRWRGQPQPWVHMVWPNPAGVPGAKITAVTPEGRNVVLLDEPGHFGLKKMIDAAQRKRKDGGVFEMSWQNDGVTVTANLKVLPAAPVPAPVQAAAPSQGFKRLRLPETITAPAAQVASAMAGGAQ